VKGRGDVGRRRRKRKVIRRVPRLPTMFQCPHCGAQALLIDIKTDKRSKKRVAQIKCGSCGIYYEMDLTDNPIADKAWVYGKFIDLYYSGEIKVEEREVEEGEEEEGTGTSEEEEW